MEERKNKQLLNRGPASLYLPDLAKQSKDLGKPREEPMGSEALITES